MLCLSLMQFCLRILYIAEYPTVRLVGIVAIDIIIIFLIII